MAEDDPRIQSFSSLLGSAWHEVRAEFVDANLRQEDDPLWAMNVIFISTNTLLVDVISYDVGKCEFFSLNCTDDLSQIESMRKKIVAGKERNYQDLFQENSHEFGAFHTSGPDLMEAGLATKLLTSKDEIFRPIIWVSYKSTKYDETLFLFPNQKIPMTLSISTKDLRHIDSLFDQDIEEITSIHRQ